MECPRPRTDNLMRGYMLQLACKIEAQCKDGVRVDSMSSLIVAVAKRRGLHVVGFENMRRSWVMKWGAHQGLGMWRFNGWGTVWPRCRGGEWGEGPSLAITAIFFLEFTYVFWLSFDGWGAVRPRCGGGEKGEGPSLAITAMFLFRIYLCISAFVLDKEACSRVSILCTQMMNSLIDIAFITSWEAIW